MRQMRSNLLHSAVTIFGQAQAEDIVRKKMKEDRYGHDVKNQRDRGTTLKENLCEVIGPSTSKYHDAYLWL
jgi:hypothetical protein